MHLMESDKILEQTPMIKFNLGVSQLPASPVFPAPDQQSGKDKIRRLAQLFLLTICLIALSLHALIAQTSWKGTTSTSWSIASNWTNVVPTANVDAIIG